MLRRCLANLLALSESDDLEIIIVDNGSTDGSVEMLRKEFPSLHRIENAKNLGFTRATNQAFERSTADYVLMLNSDTVVGEGTISECVAYLDSHELVGAVGCQLRNEDGSEQSTVFRFPSLFGLLMGSMRISQTFPKNSILNRDRYGGRRWREPTEVDVVMGSFLMVRRAALPSLPLLDERYFMYAEETDLCCRLRGAGAGVVFLPELSVTHVGGGSSKTMAQLGWSDEAKKRGILRFLFTWRGAGVAWTANLILLAGMLPRVTAWAARDLSRSVRTGHLHRHHLLRARSLAMHFAVLVDPRRALDPWGGPD
jgi:GT2 family glycosyltransferase